MKKTEEIKEGLRICTQEDHCDGCPYEKIDFCETYLERDALACIEQLEAQLAKRDNLIDVLREMAE